MPMKGSDFLDQLRAEPDSHKNTAVVLGLLAQLADGKTDAEIAQVLADLFETPQQAVESVRAWMDAINWLLRSWVVLAALELKERNLSKED